MNVNELKCRFCRRAVTHSFLDLGQMPLANAFLRREQLEEREPFYPLHAYLCGSCLLVQLDEIASPGRLFTDYVYFSSFSDTWLEHARRYTETISERFGIGPSSTVIELGSNDGYLLQYFKRRGASVLGVEPAGNVANAARRIGIPTLERFFGVAAADEILARGCQADLIVGNNVLAHVPDLNDFVAGMKMLLKPGCVSTIEFPHLLRLLQGNQFDTVYHEHFSYFSLTTVDQVFARHDLRVFDVEELPTHGGSLRIFVCHSGDTNNPTGPRVESLKQDELQAGLDSVDTYSGFAERVVAIREYLRELVSDIKKAEKSIAGYGAPAKGNTLLNYCGLGKASIDYVVDRNPRKQGLFLPGTHIPVLPLETIEATQPDFVLILPWNLTDEICREMAVIRQWGARFIVPIPHPQVLP